MVYFHFDFNDKTFFFLLFWCLAFLAKLSQRIWITCALKCVLHTPLLSQECCFVFSSLCTMCTKCDCGINSVYCTHSEPSGRAAHMMSPVTRPSAPWSPTWNEHANQDQTLHTHNPSDRTTDSVTVKDSSFIQWEELEHRVTLWSVTCTLPCSLLVGSQEDFHVLVDVLHTAESFEEILGHINKYIRSNMCGRFEEVNKDLVPKH